MKNTHTVSTDRISITFARDPFTVMEILNRESGVRVCARGRQSFLIRTPLELFEPTLLTRAVAVRARGNAVDIRLSDETGAYRAVLSVSPSDDGVRFSFKASAPKPIWLVEWKIGGLDLEEVIVPALGGQSLKRSMPAETMLSYKYPFWWNAQFVVGRHRKGTIIIRSKDEGPDLKLLRVRKESDGFAVSYGFEASGPLKNRTLSGAWFVDAFAGSWKRPVDRHRDWMKEAFKLRSLEGNPLLPAWAGDIDFVLEMWGITKDRSEPLHTFDQMLTRLKRWRKMHDPRRTLVYLPGFAMHGIDSRAPDYFPSEPLGGRRGFKRLVRAAHAMGYRVMVHTNVLAMTFSHRLFQAYRKHQVVDVFGRRQGWGLDMDGDWLAEPYFAYMNPGSRDWTRLMSRIIGELIRTYGIDAVFLDQTLLAFNVSKGPNFVRGMRRHVQALQRAFPGVLFAGEGLHEQVVSHLPVAQIHGIDSIAEVHGMEGAYGWRDAHPVSTYLFGPFTRFTAHLLTKHPSHPMFRAQEAAYARLGVIPALCLYHHSQPLDGKEVRAMVRRAGTLHS